MMTISPMTEGLTLAEESTVQRAPLAENIDAITDYSEHLRVIDQLLQRYVPESRRCAFANKIDGIVQRATNPDLNLAVIGEFSSGKSTFINGLLRSRLLKTASIATTATVTKIRKGSVLMVTVSFNDETTVTATAENTSELRHVLSARQPAAASEKSLKDLLDRLTSDPEVADSVRFIDIEFPASEMEEDIVILDTPGIGAGAAAAKNHARITQRVVHEMADCALVLIPSSNPMTSTLIDFLAGYARAFLHRCIFVVTAMDRLDEQERAETYGYVCSKLREKLSLESPIVFEAAAVTMIPNAQLPDSMKVTWDFWQAEFVVLEASIRTALLRDRTLIIAEHLIRLLQELLVEMESELAKRQAALKAEEQLLRSNSVMDLEVVLDDLYASSAAELEKRRQVTLQQNILHHSNLVAAAKDWLHELVERSGWGIKDYATQVHPQVTEAIEHYARHYVQTINQDLSDLRIRCEALATGFARQFEDSYRELSSLGVSLSVPPIEIAPLPKPSVFGSALSHAARQVGQDRRRSMAGGALGGLALGWLGSFPGTLIGSGIGATFGWLLGDDGCSQIIFALLGIFLGAVPGALFGLIAATFAGGSMGKAIAGAAGPKLLDRQKQLQNHLGADIDAFFDQARQTFDNHIDSVVTEALTSFRTAVDQHKHEYSSAVERLRCEHDSKQKAVAQKIAESRIDSTDLSQRAARLETIRCRLMRSSITAQEKEV